MGPWVQRWLGGGVRGAAAAVDLLFPPRCVCCDVELPASEDDLPLCAGCRLLPEMEPRPRCPRCGAVAEGDASERCSRCRRTPLRFDAAVALGTYSQRLREVVLRMKRPGNESLSATMGRLLARRHARRLEQFRPDLVVAVPMYWTRRLRRGANSPETLARELAKSLGVSVGRRVLRRRRNTLPQMGLPPRERFRNVRGAFGVRGARGLSDSRVLLVDDVLTTGATCSEAAKTLKRAGAVMVAAVVVARADGPEAV